MRNGKFMGSLAAVPIALCLVVAVATPRPAEAQNWLERTLKNEAKRQADRLLRTAIRCAVGEYECYEKAKEEGKEVVFVDENGEVIEDNEGNPVTDPNQLPPEHQQTAAPSSPAPPPPGPVNAAFDFEAGTRVLFHDDYSGDNLGDFPRRWELLEGSWDLVDWEGARYFRATSRGVVKIPLPEVLPEMFTIEVPVSVTHGNGYIRIATAPAYILSGRDYKGTAVAVEYSRAGLRAVGAGPEAIAPTTHRYETEGMLPLSVMADGNYMKVYLGADRVAQAPNAVFPRTDSLFIHVSSASADHPIMLGPIRVAAGGRDLYDALEAEGRVAVHDILFDTDAATIRAESAEVLTEIATMLQDHPDLSLMVEGHTDDTGEFDHNMDLSTRRAQAVKQWLVERHAIAGDRLRTMGLGPTQPKDTNDTDAGKQQNRRVELVRIGR